MLKRWQIILQELSRLEKKLGRSPTPEEVEKDARSPSSPLHQEFEWDNEKAGYQYRIDQARHLISSVRVLIKTEVMQVATVKYVRDPTVPPQEQGFVSVLELQHDPAAAWQSLQYEWDRVLALVRRVRNHAIALGLEEEFDKLVEELAVQRILVEAK